MNICSTCGQNNPDTAQTCEKCGNALSNQIKEEIIIENQPVQYEKSSTGKVIAIVLGLLLIFGSALYLLLFDLPFLKVATTTTTSTTSTTIATTTSSTTTSSTTTTTEQIKEFAVFNNQLTTITFDITTNPRGVSLYIDNKYIGATPQIINDIEPGVHTVRLEKTGYDSYSKKFIAREGSRAVFNVDFEETNTNFATVHFFTEPAGAQVFIGNKPYGFTPLTIEGLFIETYQIKYVLHNYYDYNENVEIKNQMNISEILKPIR